MKYRYTFDTNSRYKWIYSVPLQIPDSINQYNSITFPFPFPFTYNSSINALHPILPLITEHTTSPLTTHSPHPLEIHTHFFPSPLPPTTPHPSSNNHHPIPFKTILRPPLHCARIPTERKIINLPTSVSADFLARLPGSPLYSVSYYNPCGNILAGIRRRLCGENPGILWWYL